MEKKRILIVDDEEDLQEILSFNLQNEGYDVCTASSGEEALGLDLAKIDLILLDVMMGGISGFKVADAIRKKLLLSVPIIFLTAKITENDLLTGFSIGADDYITKPFSVKELIARCKAVLSRRHQPVQKMQVASDESISQLDELRVNRTTMEVFLNDTTVALTKKEYDILLLLLMSDGRVYTREEILSRVWSDETYVLERTVDVHMARLRKKLGTFGVRLVNRPGYGYSLK